ncbi:MAG: ATP-binding cassette domain-containing protein, partial [Planctomycetales bacterium]|nr:ATP-binding cassette domain-containing protein [Planctomycetales bacterium]
HGEVILAPGARVAALPQDVPRDLTGAVADVVAKGIADLSADDAEWKGPDRVAKILSRMQLAADAEFAQLSSGMKRRVLLARALVAEPDVLLLDEPTNHLDLEAILWLEEFLPRISATLLFVTHDRGFLRNLATRILEIDRGQLFDWTCDYDTFLKRKEAALAAEEKQNALFDKKLAEEEAWIRQGIKARRTRNEGRVRALQEMRRVRTARREQTGQVKLQVQDAGRSGQLVAEVDEVSFAYGEQTIVEGFSTSIMRGDKIGVIGRNGAGKTTLLKILLGQLTPQAGRVRTGTNLHIAYFDQLREQLDNEKSVADNVAEGRSSVMIHGQPRHVLGYLQDFLFTPDRARTPLKFLSGGERNRVLLARLFAQPANVIVLDEPTNDLDTETLELLESVLVEFDGAVLLVSHDREFLNNVATSTIVFEREGVREYVGGYDDWARQRAAKESADDNREAKRDSAPKVVKKPRDEANSPAGRPRKLSYNEQRELEALPAKIEELESKITALHESMAAPEFYQQTGEKISAATSSLEATQAELDAAYRRWETLEG